MANQNRYYKTPFAESGNKAEVPNVSVGGAVGYDSGFGPDYELPQGSPSRKRIERDLYNGMHYGITKNLKQWQEGLYPTWIEDDGAGVAFAYSKGMIVSHAGQDWISNEDANQEEPGSGVKWKAYAPVTSLQELSGLTKPSDLDNRFDIVFKSDSFGSAVENMVAGRIDGVISVTHTAGSIYSTGKNSWRHLGSNIGSETIEDFYPLGRMLLSEFIGEETDKTKRTAMAQLMLDLMVSAETPCRMDVSATLGTLTIDDQWGAIDIDGLLPGVGYQSTIATTISFEDEDGLIIPLKNSNHFRCSIKGFKMVQTVGSRQHSQITFDIDGTRGFNYPVKWFFEDLSPYNWENKYKFVRTGGAVDPDGFFGTTIIRKDAGFNNGRTCLFDGVYANLFYIEDCRIHSQEEHIKLQNGAGAFVDHINVHFEGVDIPRTSGLFVYDGTILESRFTFHNHDWENCGNFISVSGNPTSTPRFTFTGKNRWNSFLTDPQELPHIRLANYSSNRMLIIPNKTIVDTPETVDVRTVGPGSALDANRIRHYFVPESAANNTHILPIAQAICGAPSADAAGYGGYFNAGDKYIKAIANGGLGYFFSNSQVMKTPNVTSDSHLALSFAAKFTQNVTRVTNPLNVTINSNLIQWFNNPFQGDTGRYVCVILIEVGTGFTLDSISGGTLVGGDDCSIGYSHWHEGNRINCHDALPVAGNKLLSMWNVPAGGNVVVDVRGGSGEGTNAKFTAKIAKGIAVSEHFVNGDDSVAVNRTLTEIVNTNNADGSIAAVRGGNYDLIQYTFTNNTLSDVVATAITELL